jgi:hypothetical protein
MHVLKLASRVFGCRPNVPRRRHSSRADLFCEPLEHRRLLSTNASDTSLSQMTALTNLDVITLVSTGPTGLTPQEIRDAYEINLISFSGGTISGTGAGETIAIVDAYNDPNIASDLLTFDQEYGLSAPPSFTIDNLGATPTDAGWALETSLDVEWAHAIAPAANIILVEAASSSMSSLFAAVSFAGKQAGVAVVSMSWGSNEFYGESSDNSVFTTAAGHAGVTYIAASGDTGAAGGPEYPSVSPNVLAVGGTTLTLTASGSYDSESGWSGSTGGFSGTDSNFTFYESEASYQTSVLASVDLSDGARTTPDVSFDADPSSGVSVYDSVGYNGQSGWFQVGGTSAAAPAWAGLIAIVDQGLATGGKGSLTTTQVLTDLYSLPSSDYNDITTGSNGYSATAGYDLVTGQGTPKSNLLVAGVLAANGLSESTTTSTSTSAPTTTTTTTGNSPHKTKSKHTKVVVKKRHKVARKAASLSSSSASAGIPSESETSSRSPVFDASSSATRTSSSASASLGLPDVAALSSQTASVPAGAPEPQHVPSSRANSTSDGLGNQSLTSDEAQSSDPGNVNESEPAGTSAVAFDAQPVFTPKEKEFMSRLNIVTYEPALSQPVSVPLDPSLNTADDDFDDALAEVAESYFERQSRPVRAAAAELEESGESRCASAGSTLLATGAIAAAGYRLILRPPDDPEIRLSWYSRFPTR